VLLWFSGEELLQPAVAITCVVDFELFRGYAGGLCAVLLLAYCMCMCAVSQQSCMQQLRTVDAACIAFSTQALLASAYFCTLISSVVFRLYKQQQQCCTVAS
jgi:hypothetical protein